MPTLLSCSRGERGAQPTAACARSCACLLGSPCPRLGTAAGRWHWVPCPASAGCEGFCCLSLRCPLQLAVGWELYLILLLLGSGTGFAVPTSVGKASHPHIHPRAAVVFPAAAPALKAFRTGLYVSEFWPKSLTGEMPGMGDPWLDWKAAARAHQGLRAMPRVSAPSAGRCHPRGPGCLGHPVPFARRGTTLLGPEGRGAAPVA